ncbi:nuclear transport factor 2 family protein [Mucilaginibacter gossypii]|uniref:nuclear transport factor 2 family protein n=1 Tax=Mucilaginibacter gossypii TaxID=551996 RepID=UPI000DCED28F|nr:MULTISPECIES: nuclear transport factor 2 family protein [Mucilaginibacter]QTE34789.1 nuclear transport factor 2 family protein [Mucilaginibacter gossypii]RAV49597.1 nuclear transport factor 2 family protein [Mucilaginibacter rubeus]
MQQRELIISNYVKAYNNFDVEDMLKNLAPSVKFQNISNGDVDMELDGIAAFRSQAEQATELFERREQIIRSFKHTGNKTEIAIDYNAILAADLPNGLKKGDELNLKGHSIFTFDGDRIVGIMDIS